MRSIAMLLGRGAAIFLFAVAGPALAAGGSSSDAPRTKNSIDPDYTRAKKAIEAKDWPEAIRLLRLAESRQEKSADIANLLGYAERNQGNMDAAFAHYAKALQLDPKHRGAHEYVGEAYLMVGNLAKAEEHLTALGKLCRSSCEEFDDLKKSIDDYKRKQSG